MSDARLVYVYCVSAPGVEAALAPLEGLEPGLAPYAIAAPPAPGLVAVASDVPAAGYAEDALRARLLDLDWTGAKGVAHERVVETCFLAAPTVPFRFCTIFADRGRVEGLLARHGERLAEILRALAGKAEWGLRAYVDRARFEAHHAAERAAAARPAAAGQGKGAGRAYLEAKKAKEDARRAAGDALAGALASVYAAHEAMADDAVRQPAGDAGELALKAAFLVPLERRAGFEAAAAAERARRAPQGIDVRVTGPWPPYAFVPRLEREEANA